MIEAIKQYIKTYGTLLKWGLVIANFFLMVVAIQTYVNHTKIIENTSLVEQETQRIKDEISYFNNFQLKYLNSEHANRLLSHENNILTPGEAVIAFKAINKIENTEDTSQIEKEELSPREERKNFFQEKWNPETSI